MAYTDRDIADAQKLGFKAPKALADALATQAAFDAQETAAEAAEILQKLSTGATAKEAPELLARLADLQVRKGALAQTGVRQALNARVSREWDATRVGFADDLLITRISQFDAVNEAAQNVPLALAEDIRASLDAPAEQATAAVRLHTAMKELSESVQTAGRFGSVKTPPELQSRTAHWFIAIKLLAEWTDFSGNFPDAYAFVQPLRRNLKSVSGMTVEDAPHPLFSPVGAVLLAKEGLKFVNRPVAERAAAVQRVAEDSANWTLEATTEGPKLLTRADAEDAARKADAARKQAEFLKNAAGAMGIAVDA